MCDITVYMRYIIIIILYYEEDRVDKMSHDYEFK